MNEKQTAIYEYLCDMTGEQVVNILTDWHGNQLLTNDLYDELVNEYGLYNELLEEEQ